MTSSTSNSKDMDATHTGHLPGRKEQWEHFLRLVLRVLLPLGAVGVVLCWGLDVGVRTELIGKTPTHGAAKLARIQTPRPQEIAILGSSRAQSSYIPDSLGPAYYNYGINGIGYAVMDIFLQYELAQETKHTPILLNFDYRMFYYQTGDLNSYLPHTHIPALRSLLKRQGKFSPHLDIPGIRYYGSLDALVKDRLNERLQLTKVINKGAAIERAVKTPAQFAKLVQQRLDSAELYRPWPELIDTLFQRIHSHPQREFVIVKAPYHQSYYTAMPAEDFAQAERLLQRLDMEPNVRVIDFDTHDWPDSLFYNTTHVSLAGARLLSHMLRDSLAQHLPL